METLVKIRNAQMVQLNGELAAARKLIERRASYSEAMERLEQLKELAGNFRRTQTRIEESQDDPEAVASVHNIREEFNTAYFEAKDILERYIADTNPDETGSSSSGRTIVDSDIREAIKMLLNTQRSLLEGQQAAAVESANRARGNVNSAAGEQVSNCAPLNVRLPPINVPTFTGDRKSWRSFKDIFESTIHNRNDLRDALKMQYLLSYLEGSAKQLVSSYPISDANYQEAWETLTNVYDKKKYTVFALVREFVDQAAVLTATPGSLRMLVSTSDEVVRQLNALGDEYNTRDPWLIHLLLEKLDKETRALWAQRIIDEENPSFEDFLKFLDNRCDALETCTAFAKKATEVTRKEIVKKPAAEKRFQSLHSTAAGEKCAKCSSEHPLFQCGQFKQMDTKCKRELVRKARLCYNCLRSSHTVKFCGSKSVCRNENCKQRHHTLLCEQKCGDEVPKKPEINGESKQPQVNESVINSMVAHIPVEAQRKVFVLPTAIIRVLGNDGGFLEVRALVDSGSEASLVTEACVRKLALPRSNGKLTVSGLGMQVAGTTRGLVKLVIANRFENTVVLQTNAFVMGKLTSTLPSQHCRVHPSLMDKQIQNALADPGYHRPGSIDIILGADVFLALLKPGQVKDNDGSPVAQNTIFGWLVSGNQAIYSSIIQANVSIINLHLDLDVNRTLRMFWEQEEVSKPQQLTPSEQAAIELFRSTHERDEKGHFIVRLPFNDSKLALGGAFGGCRKNVPPSNSTPSGS
ncbi:uncharacterized protein LOC134206064 [Armigeres subalbatus]|uniref:uncharacterized protein LOC134206064 n=1 Tax=Armigeres subalbatus TaxID=124917 RepID=UPI002ED5A003